MTDQHVISVEPNGTLSVDGVPTGAHLTKMEIAFLRAAFAHRYVSTKEYLLDVMYAGQDEPELKIVDVWLCKVRRKLGDHAGAIETVRGRGYAPHRDYVLAPADDCAIRVHADAELIEELIYITGEQPDALVSRLLKAERERVWA